ncbi:MAG: hypothetical protein K0U62_11560 [Actinomycetia bacterium]|nr:hypothetical protein [Actinomycetes bacterium]
MVPAKPTAKRPKTAPDATQARAPRPGKPLPTRKKVKKAPDATKKHKRSEIQRILALPKDNGHVPDLTVKLRRPGGQMKLFPIQNSALWHAHKAKGLLGLISVGSGKTLISVLLPRVLGARRPVLLVPAAMRDQFQDMWDEYNQHFYISKLRVISYAELSNPKNREMLLEYKPDLIIADEAHYLRHRHSARTRRVIEYLKSNPACKFCAMSGTLTNRSVVDYAHLASMSLRGGSPIPRDWMTLNAFANILDSTTKGSKNDWGLFAPFFKGIAGTKAKFSEENARKAFRYRLVKTSGVVATKKKDIGSTLYIHERHIPTPPKVQSLIQKLQMTWVAPNGDEISDPMALARIGRQLSQGFYYEWEWPNGQPDYVWLKARKMWNRVVRKYLMNNNLGLDSPLLVRNAIIDGRIKNEVAKKAWLAWEAVRDRPEPPTIARWVDPFLVKDAVAWARWTRSQHPNEGVILWYDSHAIEDALRKAGIRCYGAGDEIPRNPTAPSVIGASIAVHGTGKNLQAYANQTILAPPASGAAWEQLLGRTHRTGQMSDEVHATVYRHTFFFNKALENAIRDAKYIFQTQGQKQKLAYAVWTKGGSKKAVARAKQKQQQGKNK